MIGFESGYLLQRPALLRLGVTTMRRDPDRTQCGSGSSVQDPPARSVPMACSPENRRTSDMTFPGLHLQEAAVCGRQMFALDRVVISGVPGNSPPLVVPN